MQQKFNPPISFWYNKSFTLAALSVFLFGYHAFPQNFSEGRILIEEPVLCILDYDLDGSNEWIFILENRYLCTSKTHHSKGGGLIDTIYDLRTDSKFDLDHAQLTNGFINDDIYPDLVIWNKKNCIGFINSSGSFPPTPTSLLDYSTANFPKYSILGLHFNELDNSPGSELVVIKEEETLNVPIRNGSKKVLLYRNILADGEGIYETIVTNSINSSIQIDLKNFDQDALLELLVYVEGGFMDPDFQVCYWYDLDQGIQSNEIPLTNERINHPFEAHKINSDNIPDIISGSKSSSNLLSFLSDQNSYQMDHTSTFQNDISDIISLSPEILAHTMIISFQNAGTFFGKTLENGEIIMGDKIDDNTYSDLRLRDVNNDGKLDIVGKKNNSTYWFENRVVLNTVHFRKETGFTFYPNPATSEIHLISKKRLIRSDILDINGNELLSSHEPILLVNQLDSGVYQLKVSFSDGSIENQLFIKQ